MTTPAYDFERVADDLMAVAADVRLGEVFGAPCITSAGKAFAALDQGTGAMAFKLGDGDAGPAGGGPWDPRGDGHPVPGWVVVPHDRRLPGLRVPPGPVRAARRPPVGGGRGPRR